MSSVPTLPPVNLIPSGLLDFLGIKSGGRNPEFLNPGLLGVINLLDWYAQTNAEEFELTRPAIGPAAPTGLNWTATTPVDITVGGALVVPQVETWVLLQYEAEWTFNAAAGEILNISPAVSISTTGASTVLANSLAGHTASNAAQQLNGRRAIRMPWFIPGGSTLIAFSHGCITAGTIAVAGRLRLLRLRT